MKGLCGHRCEQHGGDAANSPACFPLAACSRPCLLLDVLRTQPSSPPKTYHEIPKNSVVSMSEKSSKRDRLEQTRGNKERVILLFAEKTIMDGGGQENATHILPTWLYIRQSSGCLWVGDQQQGGEVGVRTTLQTHGTITMPMMKMGESRTAFEQTM